MDRKRYIISDAAKMVDVEAHVLRYWEDELELPIERNEMGHRCYTEDNIRTFHQIKELKEQGYQLKAIKAILPEMEQGKIPPAIVQRQEPEPAVDDKMQQFQLILGKVVAEALRENQLEMGKELSHQVSTQVVKEMDYLFRLREEQEESHYKKLDELIRNSQQKRRALAPGRREKKQKEPKVKKIREKKEAHKRSWFGNPKTVGEAEG
ncbi:MAG: helix-turn-helix domain-containing protein [Lachnospiraceae bacterium]|nr:helix-turn-helix domain-containing protein [Lachnospiraceae bacterium]